PTPLGPQLAVCRIRMVTPGFGSGPSRVCQSGFIWLKYWARWIASVNCVGSVPLVKMALENTGEANTGATNGVASEINGWPFTILTLPLASSSSIFTGWIGALITVVRPIGGGFPTVFVYQCRLRLPLESNPSAKK